MEIIRSILVAVIFFLLGVRYGQKSEKRILGAIDVVAKGNAEMKEKLQQVKLTLQDTKEFAKEKHIPKLEKNLSQSLSQINNFENTIQSQLLGGSKQILLIQNYWKDMQKNLSMLKEMQKQFQLPAKRIKELRETLNNATMNAYAKHVNASLASLFKNAHFIKSEETKKI